MRLYMNSPPGLAVSLVTALTLPVCVILTLLGPVRVIVRFLGFLRTVCALLISYESGSASEILFSKGHLHLAAFLSSSSQSSPSVQ